MLVFIGRYKQSAASKGLTLQEASTEANKHSTMLQQGIDVAQYLKDKKKAEAEKLKHRHGCALTSLIAPGEMIEMPRIGERDSDPLPRRKMSEIIEARVEEIFELVREQLDFADLLDQFGAGVVLTGGSAILEGMPDLAQRVFRMSARRGMPQYVSDVIDPANSPMYAAAVGLILCNLQDGVRAHPLGQLHDGQNWQRMRERVVEWLRDFF